MKIKVKRKISPASLTVVSLTLSGPISAKTMEDFHSWNDVALTGSLGVIDPALKNVKFLLEGIGRFGKDSSQLSKGMLRAGLGYALNDSTSVWLGYAWFTYDEPFASTPFDEHRIWQDFTWSHKYAFATVSSRSRLEQRFMDTGSDVGWRFRQRVKVSVPLTFAPDFSLVGWEEYFANINKTNYGADDGFDQNRVFAGIGYNFDTHIRTEVGYMNNYFRKVNRQDRMDHCLAVSLFFNF
jgi:hypothetical protein